MTRRADYDDDDRLTAPEKRVDGPLFGVPTPESNTRRTDPDTSLRAAEAALRDASSEMQRVYALLERRGPLTDHEICLEMRSMSARRRRSDLTRRGLVVDTGSSKCHTVTEIGGITRTTQPMALWDVAGRDR